MISYVYEKGNIYKCCRFPGDSELCQNCGYLSYAEINQTLRLKPSAIFGDIGKIQCYPNRLNQVFMNVLNNASQAIQDKGTIAIKTTKEKEKVFIRIIDDGEGIKKDNLSKIFDPGFTTRGVGVGTGLGLSISYNIIKDHNGEIKVKSDVGKGTEILIIVPIKQMNVPTQVSEN